MSIYDEMQKIARDVLGDQDFKQGLTNLVRITPGTGSVDDPGAPVESMVPLDGAVRGVQFRYVASTMALASDLQITCAVPPGPAPTMRDFVEVDGLRHKIVQIIPKPAAGVPVAYTLIIRR